MGAFMSDDEEWLARLTFLIDMCRSFGGPPPRPMLGAHARLSYKLGEPWAVQYALSRGWPNTRTVKAMRRRPR